MGLKEPILSESIISSILEYLLRAIIIYNIPMGEIVKMKAMMFIVNLVVIITPKMKRAIMIRLDSEFARVARMNTIYGLMMAMAMIEVSFIKMM